TREVRSVEEPEVAVVLGAHGERLAGGVADGGAVLLLEGDPADPGGAEARRPGDLRLIETVEEAALGLRVAAELRVGGRGEENRESAEEKSSIHGRSPFRLPGSRRPFAHEPK